MQISLVCEIQRDIHSNWTRATREFLEASLSRPSGAETTNVHCLDSDRPSGQLFFADNNTAGGFKHRSNPLLLFEVQLPLRVRFAKENCGLHRQAFGRSNDDGYPG